MEKDIGLGVIGVGMGLDLLYLNETDRCKEGHRAI